MTELAGWTPTDVDFDASPPRLVWSDLRDPARRAERVSTGLDALETRGRPAVAGLLLHASRCGSTLACRMLATDPGIVVISEPPVLDALLRAPAPAAERVGWVAGLLGAFATGGRRVVVKADAWSVLEMDVLKAAAPGAPWAFMTRDAGEIIASHMREPGMHVVPGLLPLGIGDGVPGAAYCARVLARITIAAREALDGRAIVVDYADMPDAVIDRIAPHFAIAGDPERMRAAAIADAKRPHERFDAERSRAERPVTREVRAAAATVPSVLA